MWEWWLCLGLDLLLPITILVIGILIYKFPPKNINGFYGYRTSRSMKNIDTWMFANKHCGKVWFILGCSLIIPTIISHIPFYNSSSDTIFNMCIIVMIIQTMILCFSIIPTEVMLRKKFDKEGNKIEKK